MCKFWSAILTRDGLVLWDKDIKSHSDLIKKFGLKDIKLKDRDFVRIEITPENILSKKRGDWHYKVDEEGTLPDWYCNDTRAQERVVWAEWTLMVKQMHQSFKDARVRLDRFAAILERLKKVNLKTATVNRSTVRAAVSEHVKRLTATDPQHRVLAITEVQFHTQKEWDQLRDQLRDQLWDQLRDQLWGPLRDQLWDQLRDQLWGPLYASLLMDDTTDPWYSLIDALESGCLLMGIDKDGVAHVVMVGKDEEVA
jgi:hypothetical protein